MWNQFDELSEDHVFDNAFLVKTVFRVSNSSGMAYGHPTLNAYYNNKKCAIAVDETLCIFDKEQFLDGKNLTFEAKIDCLIVAESMVICGLSNGCIYGVHISGVPLFSTNIDEHDVSDGYCFVNVLEHDGEFYFCCKNGKIYKTLDIDIERFGRSDENNAENTLNINETLSQDVSLVALNDKKCSNSISAYNIIACGAELLHVFGSSTFLYCYQESQPLDKLQIVDLQGVTKIQCIDSVCLFLGGNGALYEFCPYTKFYHPIEIDNGWSIKDFNLQETHDSDIDLLIFATNADNQYYTKVFNYKGLESKWSLRTEKNSTLVMQPKSSVCLYYLCGKSTQNNGDIDQVELKVLSEYRPEARLLTLLGRGLIAEAEQIADQFNLSKQPIYEAKAKQILTSIVAADPNQVDQIQVLFTELTDIAKLMENRDYLLQLRDMQISQRSIMRRYSELLIEYLDAVKYKDILKEIGEQLLRLNTLDLFDPNECYIKWQKFVQEPNLDKFLLSFLKTDIPVACSIMSRHSSNILANLNGEERNCTKIFAAIPKDAEPLQIVQWVRHFYPMATERFPAMAPIIISWTIEKTTSFEGSEQWPLIGIEFAREMLRIFDNTKHTFNDVRRQQSTAEKLNRVIFTLEELEVLKVEYNLRIPFDEYFNSTIDNRAMHLLRRTNLRNLRNLVENFIFVICREKGEDAQAVLFTYIQQVIASRKTNQTWLERAVACMELLCDTVQKLQIALSISRSAPVPWDQAMKPIIALMHTSHKIAQQIKTEYHRMDFKILLSKYNYNTENTNTDYLKLLQHCIKNNPDPIDDIKLIKKQVPADFFRLNMMTVIQLVTTGRIDVAITFLNNLPKAETRNFLRHVGSAFTNMIDDFITKPNIYEGILEILKYVINKDASSEYKQHVQQLVNLHKLAKSDLRLMVTMKDLEKNGAIEMHVNTGVERILNALKSAKVGLVPKITTYISLIANALGVDELVVVQRLASTVNDVQFTTLLAKIFSDHRAKDSHYIEMAKLLVLQQYSAIVNNSSIKLNQDVSYAYPMAHLYMLKVRSTLDANDFLKLTGIGANDFDFEQVAAYRKDSGVDTETDAKILDVLDKLTTVKREKETQRRDSWSMFETVQAKATVKVVDNKIEAVLKSVNDVLYVIVHYLKPKTFVHDMFKTAIPKVETYDRSQVITSLDTLLKMKLFSTVYAILDFYKSQQRHTESKFIGTSTYQILLHKLLKIALQQKEPRADMLAIYLRSDSNPEHTLETLKQELSVGVPRLNCLLLCERYGQLTGNAELMNASKDARLKYDYYLQLRQIDPTVKDTFEITNSATLFDSLTKKVLDIDFLQRMSKDLGWNYQEVLIHQMFTILKMHELDYDVEVDEVLGDEQITIKTNIDTIQAQYMPYLKQITDNKLLSIKVKQFIETIDPHFYEMYVCALHMLHVVGTLDSFKDMKHWMDILEYMMKTMVKKRARRIGSVEDDWWIKYYNDMVMPNIAKYRIPFTILVDKAIDFKTIIGEQVTVDNCIVWFPLIQMLATMNGIADIPFIQDTLCMQAVKETIDERKPSLMTNAQKWNLQPMNNAFLRSVLNLVKHMTDKNRILLVLYMVFCQSPDGADQLESIEECFKFAVEHEQILLGKPQANLLIEKIKFKYPMIKAQHKMHLYGLYDDELSSLISNPVEFIKALYNRPNVLAAHEKLDLNLVAEDFASLFGMDIRHIQMSLLSSWFAVKTTDDGNGLDQTFCDTDLNATGLQIREDAEFSDDIVEKVYYIMKSWKKEDAHSVLISGMTYNNDGSLLDTGHNLQLYDCLIKLTDKQSIGDFKALIPEEKYIALKCVHNLKPLGFNLTIEKFHAYDKVTILKQIWSTNASNPKALKVMCFICIGYNIFEPKLWNGILRQMVGLHMDTDLMGIINRIAGQEQLVHNSDGLVIAYEYLIRLPFANITKVRSPEQDETMCEALFLFQSCPVQHKLQLVDLAMSCINSEQPHIASIFMVLVNDADRGKIYKVLRPFADQKLRKDIIELEELGIYPFTTKRALALLKL